MRRDAARQGVALALVLALLAVAAAFGAIIFLLTRSANRELDVLSSHMRAVAVAEVAYAAVVGRLNVTPWSQRWFRGRPDAQQDVPAAGGAYSYVLRDTPVLPAAADAVDAATLFGPHQADLLVRATCERASATLYWRLLVPTGTLDSAARAVPTFFVFAPDGTSLSPAGLDPLGAQVNQQLLQRARNRAGFEARRPPLDRAKSAPEIETALGFQPGRVVDGVEPPGGGAPRDNPGYLGEVQQAASPPPPLVPPAPPPTPTPTPTPTSLIAPTGAPGMQDAAQVVTDSTRKAAALNGCLQLAQTATTPDGSLLYSAANIAELQAAYDQASGLAGQATTAFQQGHYDDAVTLGNQAQSAIVTASRMYSALQPPITCSMP